MTAAVVVLDPADKQWADAEMAAIANDVGDAHAHIRNLYDNWTEGRAVQQFYINPKTGEPFESPASAFAAKYPGVMSKSQVQATGQSHRLRRLLGGGSDSKTPPEDVVSDRSLRAFGDPDRWDAEELRAFFAKAQDIASQRIAGMEAKGKTASRGVITGDILEAMGRPRNVGTSSVGYWHQVLNNLTINHAGLTATMAIQVAATAVWAAVELGQEISPSEMASLRKQLARLDG